MFFEGGEDDIWEELTNNEGKKASNNARPTAHSQASSASSAQSSVGDSNDFMKLLI